MVPDCRLILTLLLLILFHTDGNNSASFPDLNLPREHAEIFLRNNPKIAEECAKDEMCPYKNEVINSKESKSCWGYEKHCTKENSFSYPTCPGEAKGWFQKGKKSKDKVAQLESFWEQGDFGYIREKLSELRPLCKAKEKDDSSLVCGKNMVYCYAKNLFMDFGKLNSNEHFGKLDERYRENVFKETKIGGHCRLDKKALSQQGEWKSPLQSWYAELEHYSRLDFKPLENGQKNCDLVLERPTVFIKLDAGVNLFHHFCDFVNLYASQHMNQSFDQDINVVMWDTSNMAYTDLFAETWRAFTRHPITHLRDYSGKKVCIRDAMFPLLARMRFGLYYNMPLIGGCVGSGLFRAFNEHVMHRLDIAQSGPLKAKVRVTLLSRSTKYRRILNEDELVRAMNTRGDLQVKVVDYKYRVVPFLEQVKASHNSDVFIGMHGSGLAHVLFQPDWGVLFELYNCDDADCYKDLARLRGAHYITWEKQNKLEQEDEGHHPTLGAHKKFTNYKFDMAEFMRLIDVAVERVRSHPRYRDVYRNLHGGHRDEL